MYSSTTIPGILILLLAFVCVLLMIAGLRRGMKRADISISRVNAVTFGVATATALWALTTGFLAMYDFFSNFEAKPPRLLIALVIPGSVALIAAYRSDVFERALKVTPASWLIYLQSFRILVELLLWNGYKHGAIPSQMTFEGKNFDILVGLTAPLAAWVLARTQNRTFGIVWNVAGLCLLGNIVLVAILSMPTPYRIFTEGPANTLLTRFPFIFLPAVLVPIAYVAHVLSIRQLAGRREAD